MPQQVSGSLLKLRPQNIFFKAKVEALSGEKMDLCFQCGTCSSGCPLTEEMDLLPSTLIRFVQLGLDEALDSRTIWICSACFKCEVRCPRGIDIANVMEALREMMLRKKHEHIRLDSHKSEELRNLPQIALISYLRKLSG